ncbi:MAG: GRAM domain-containing protein [Bacteroidales bacterium]|nr:GRAM domain-containing protein [Bacteroidales bacterium]
MFFRSLFGNIIVGMIISLLVFVVLINNNVSIGVDMIFITLLISGLFTLLWYYLYRLMQTPTLKRVRLIQPQLKPEELVILDGIARTTTKPKYYGKLFLTNKRLGFYPSNNSNEVQPIYIDLREVCEIKSNVNVMKLRKYLEIKNQDASVVLEVDFPTGWKDVIEGQIL